MWVFVYKSDAMLSYLNPIGKFSNANISANLEGLIVF